MTLFDLVEAPPKASEPEPTWPEWFRPSRDAPAWAKRVLIGRHPTGLTLGPEASTCGTCAHLVERHHGRVYWKCRLCRQSACTATDIRRKWRGCSKWEPRSAAETLRSFPRRGWKEISPGTATREEGVR
jgi:hypothetical protein